LELKIAKQKSDIEIAFDAGVASVAIGGGDSE